MSLIDCFGRHLDDAQHKYLVAKIGQIKADHPELSEKEIARKAVKDFQNEIVHSLEGVYQQIGMPGYEKAESNKESEKTEPTENQQQGQTIAFAPYRSRNVSSTQEDTDIRNSPEYKLHQENVQNIANGLGIKITNSADTWGGWVDTETGKPVTEVSNLIHIDGTPEQARLLAAALGKIAPEEQNAVMVGHHQLGGEGTEFTIKTGSFENGQKALGYLKENGLEYFTLDKSTGDLYIVDGDNSNKEKIVNFIKQLKDNGITTETTSSHTNTEFIESGSYGQILEGERDKARTENGFDLNAYIEEARKKYEELGKKPEEDKKEPAAGGGDRPPNEPPPKNTTTTADNQSGWTPIRRAEITAVKDTFRKIGVKWTEIMDKAMTSLSDKATGGKTLYDAASEFVHNLHGRLKDGEAIVLNSEDTAKLAFHRFATVNQMEALENLTSGDKYEKGLADMQYDKMKSQLDLVDAVLGATASEAGRAFGLRQIEGKYTPDYSLKMRRMERERALGRELTEDEEQEVSDLFHQEQEINKEKEEHDRAKKMEEFEKRVQEEVDKRLKEQKKEATTKGGKVGKEKAKAVADKLRKFADKLEGFGSANLPEGTQTQGISVQKMAADAIRYIADNIENGRIPELIDRAVKAFKSDELSPDDLRKKIQEGLLEAGISPEDIGGLTNREKAIDGITKVAEAEGETSITPEMVRKGQIRDFIHSFIDEGVPADKIMDEALKHLKSFLPDTNLEELRDAYMKEGDYKLPVKDTLAKKRQEKVNELKNVTKLQTDLGDLRQNRELRSRGHASSREKSDFEKGLEKEKEALLKERKEVEKQASEAKNREKKLAALDEKIRNVTQRGEAWQRLKRKTDKEIDQEYAAKKKELQVALDKAGIKIERGSAFKRASKEKVANSFNERSKQLSEKLAERAEKAASEEEKKIIEKLKSELDRSSVNTGTVQDVDQLLDKSLEKIRGLISGLKRQIANHVGDKQLSESLADLNGDLSELVYHTSEDRKRSEQDVATEQYKKKLQADINRFQKELDSGVFAEPKRSTPSHDGKAMELEVKKNKVLSSWKRMKERDERNKMSSTEKAIQAVKDTRRAALITNIIGLGKVFTSALSKIGLEPLTRATTGRLYDLTLGRNVSKAYGGEGFDTLAEIKALEAAFGKLSQAEMLRQTDAINHRMAESGNLLAEANTKADQIKEQFGEDSPEYKDFVNKELTKALERHKRSMLESGANMLYHFIGTDSWKDALNTIIANAARVEEMMGNIKSTHWSDLKEPYEKYSYVIDTFGRIHSGMKNFSARNAFARGYILRMRRAVEKGEDISEPATINRIAAGAYNDFLQGKYMQKNLLTDLFKGITNYIRAGSFDKDNKWETQRNALATLLEFDAPIVRVPTNILAEKILEYKYGVITGAFMQAWEAGKGFKAGYAENKDLAEGLRAMRNHLSHLPPEKADMIGRYFRKGMFGAGMYYLGAMSYATFGGFYNQNDREKKKPGELGLNELLFGKWKMPKYMEKIASHIPLFATFLSGANTARIYHKEFGENGESSLKSVSDAVWADFQNDWDELPLQPGRLVDPRAIVNYPMFIPGQGIIKDASELREELSHDGQLEPRTPQDYLDRLKLSVGMRSSVPTKEVGDKIKKIKTQYKKTLKAMHQQNFDQSEIDRVKKEGDQAVADEIKNKN